MYSRMKKNWLKIHTPYLTWSWQFWSPEQNTEQSIAQFKYDNADVNNYIGKHFKFYKEIWLTDDENRTNKVDFQLI